MSDGSTTWTNTYGADGLRTKRTDGTTTYRYRYTDGLLATMNIDDDVEMWFMYDDNGPLVIKYGNAESHKVYHYELNLQGDVIAIISTTGERVVEYTYDAWGNVLSITGSAANTIGVNNPLRYRGYIYDPETQLYYCQSRYYNPEMGRFLNADTFASTGQGLLGNNMFAYCGNNPVNYADRNGYEPEEVVDVNGDGVVDYYVYTYTSTTGILWWKKQRTGRVYIFVGKSTEFFDDSANHPDNFNSKTDLLVGDFTTSNNPMMYAYRADRTETKNWSSILQCLLQYDKDFDTAWDRTLDSLLVEWREHKRYAFASDRARNIDFDNAEEGMGASYYFKKAWDAVFN